MGVESEGDDSDPTKPPPKPRGWRSAAQLMEEFVGGSDKIKRQLEQLRVILADDLIQTAGMSQQEAEQLIADHLVGTKTPRRGIPAISASPDAIPLLNLPRKAVTRLRPEGWKGMSALKREYGRHHKTLERRILRLAEQLIKDIAEATQCSKKEAESLVADHLISRNKPTRGANGLAVSPDGLRIAEHFRHIIRDGPIVGDEHSRE